MHRTRIGITLDVDAERAFCRLPYIDALLAAGAMPVLLPPVEVPDQALVVAILASCDGVILSGGDDPVMEPFGEPTHPKATPLSPRRQAFELALLAALAAEPERPVLGICLGMQLMALAAGGRLDQHLPDHGDRFLGHWGRKCHRIEGDLGTGVVMSHHRQAVSDPGALEVIATAPDGVIEAVRDPRRRWSIGVQWHPEITVDPTLGSTLITTFVDESRRWATTLRSPSA